MRKNLNESRKMNLQKLSGIRECEASIEIDCIRSGFHGHGSSKIESAE